MTAEKLTTEVNAWFCQFCGVQVAHARAVHEHLCAANPKRKKSTMDMRSINRVAQLNPNIRKAGRISATEFANTQYQITTINISRSDIRRIEFLIPAEFMSRSEFIRTAIKFYLDHLADVGDEK